MLVHVNAHMRKQTQPVLTSPVLPPGAVRRPADADHPPPPPRRRIAYDMYRYRLQQQLIMAAAHRQVAINAVLQQPGSDNSVSSSNGAIAGSIAMTAPTSAAAMYAAAAGGMYRGRPGGSGMPRTEVLVTRTGNRILLVHAHR